MSCGNFEKAGKALIKKFCRGGQREPIHRKRVEIRLISHHHSGMLSPICCLIFFSCSSRPLDSPS